MQKISVYEKSGEKHVFEVCRQNIKGAAPYVIYLDDSFHATAESGAEVSEEIQHEIDLNGWSYNFPF